MERQRNAWFLFIMGFVLGGLFMVVPSIASSGAVAEVTVETWGVSFQPLAGNYEKLVLTVVGPEGKRVRHEFAPGEEIFLEVGGALGGLGVDGLYKYELVVVPLLDETEREELLQAREDGDPGLLREFRDAGRLSAERRTQSGVFRILDGNLVSPDEPEPAPKVLPPQTAKRSRSSKGGTASQTKGSGRQAGHVGQSGGSLAQVILEDLIVIGSSCVGLDCVSVENFGFDTLRLKENNVRFHFDDTSATGSFPNNDWRLVANDSTNGGANKFSIEDATAARIPFTIEAAAPSNSLYVDSSGRIGIKTSTPVVEIHVADGDSPTLRLEQDGSSGFTPQTWDIAGNETNFFIRDATNGSKLPFRIRPGAPTDALHILANGNVGLGTASASAPLHVKRTDGTAKLLVEEASTALGARVLGTFTNKGRTSIELAETYKGQIWRLENIPNMGFFINKLYGGGIECQLDLNGNLTISGALTQGSDRNSKRDIVPVDGGDVLERLSQVPIAQWSYKADKNGTRHMGPMAQDFHEAFGLGSDPTRIAPLDVAGAALAAVRTLDERVRERETVIQELKNRNTELEARLAALEELVRSQAGNSSSH